MTIYAIDPKDYEIESRFRDQFGETRVKILTSGFMAVPTAKGEVTVEPDSIVPQGTFPYPVPLPKGR